MDSNVTDETRLLADEYEKQYFGFSSSELIADYREKVEAVIQKHMTDIHEAIAEEFELGAEGDKDVAQRIQELQKAYQDSAKAPLVQFEAEVRKTFAIPTNVLLEEDQLRCNPVSDGDIIELQKEVEDLKRQVLQEKVFLAKSKQLIESIEIDVNPMYDQVNNLISSAKKVIKSSEALDESKQKKLIETHEKYKQRYLSSNAYYEDFQSVATNKFRDVQNC